MEFILSALNAACLGLTYQYSTPHCRGLSTMKSNMKSNMESNMKSSIKSNMMHTSVCLVTSVSPGWYSWSVMSQLSEGKAG